MKRSANQLEHILLAGKRQVDGEKEGQEGETKRERENTKNTGIITSEVKYSSLKLSLRK